jgi:hypothetical protein
LDELGNAVMTIQEGHLFGEMEILDFSRRTTYALSMTPS